MNGPIVTVADSPGCNRSVPVIPMTFRSWAIAPVFVTFKVIVSPAATSIVGGETNISPSVMSNSVSIDPAAPDEAAALDSFPNAPITATIDTISAAMPITKVRSHNPPCGSAGTAGGMLVGSSFILASEYRVF